MKKITLVTCGFPDGEPFVPLGLLYVGTYLDKHGYEVKIIDSQIHEDIENRIRFVNGPANAMIEVCKGGTPKGIETELGAKIINGEFIILKNIPSPSPKIDA